MSEVDLFRYLTEGSNAYTIETIAFNMAVTTALGIFIFFVYKRTFTGVLYSLSFNISILMVAMITSMIIMLIGSNLAISLGMVGALSIVRFRSAVKEPRDLAFLFWAIGVGLASGTGAFLIAAIGSVFLAAMIAAFGRAAYADSSYLLVLKGKEVDQKAAEQILKDYGIKHKLRMQNVSGSRVEITYEVFLKKQKARVLMEHLSGSGETGVEDVNLVSFQGEITG